MEALSAAVWEEEEEGEAVKKLQLEEASSRVYLACALAAAAAGG